MATVDYPEESDAEFEIRLEQHHAKEVAIKYFEQATNEVLALEWTRWDDTRRTARDRVGQIEMVLNQRKADNDGKMPKIDGFTVLSQGVREYSTPPGRLKIARK